MDLGYLIHPKNFPVEFEKERADLPLKNKETQKHIQWWYIGD